MRSSHIIYRSREDATPTAELSALANVYRYVIDSHAKKKAADATTESDDRTDAAIVKQEEVRHVELRSDRSSEITKPAALLPQKLQIRRSAERPLVQKECTSSD